MLTPVPANFWVLVGFLLSHGSSDWKWTQWFQPPHYRGQTSDELVRIMKGPDCNKSIRAAMRLNDLGIESAETIPALRRALRDKNSDTRFNALFLAGLLGGKTLVLAPELVDIALHDQEIDRQNDAVGDLAFANPPTPEILDTLTKSLEHSSDMIRSNAAWSLGKLGPQAKPALTTLRKKIRDANARVRVQAVLALWRIAHEKPDLSILTGSLGRNEQFESLIACGALAEIGTAARAAAPELKRRLTAADPTAKPYFAEAL